MTLVIFKKSFWYPCHVIFQKKVLDGLPRKLAMTWFFYNYMHLQHVRRGTHVDLPNSIWEVKVENLLGENQKFPYQSHRV